MFNNVGLIHHIEILYFSIFFRMLRGVTIVELTIILILDFNPTNSSPITVDECAKDLVIIIVSCIVGFI